MISFPTLNGVCLIDKDKQVVVSINSYGEKKLKSFRAENKVVLWRFPFVRGLQFFFFGIFVFLKNIFSSFDVLTKADKKKKTTLFYVLLSISVFVSIVFAVFFFGFLPARLGWVLVGEKGNDFVRNLIIALFKICFFYAFMFSLRLLPYVNGLFRFNFALEVGVSGKKQESKTPNFLNCVVFVFLLDFVVITLCGARFGVFFNLLFYVAVFLVCVLFAYEILAVTTNVKALSYLNLFTMCLVAAKPTRTHTEAVSIALTEMHILQKGRDFMTDENKKAFSVVFSEVKNKLAAAGIIDKSDAEWIIATALGKSRGEIRLVPFVTDKQYADIIKAAERRAKGESVDNIFGFTEFYGLRFDVNKKVLTPRMETELLVEQVLKSVKNYKKCSVLDLGTGSGAIAISIAKNCDAAVTAVDVSKVALATAESNAKKNGVKIEFFHSNLFDNLKRKLKFDIIVSNPPYIPSDEIEKLDKNVRECDPVLALDGGKDGLDFYRQIISSAKGRLTAKGQIFFEVGKGQAAAVRKLLRENGFGEIKTVKDYNKIERIVSGTSI